MMSRGRRGRYTDIFFLLLSDALLPVYRNDVGGDDGEQRGASIYQNVKWSSIEGKPVNPCLSLRKGTANAVWYN